VSQIDGERADTETEPSANTGQDLSVLTQEFLRHGRILHRTKIRLARMLPEGLDWAAGALLGKLAHHGPTRQGELADRALLDPSTVSRYVGQLVRSGLVERRPDPEDGRAVLLAATDAGQSLADHVLREHNTLLHQVLDRWDPADLHALTTLLRQFNNDMESFPEAAVDDDTGSARRPPYVRSTP
jgi:DNA-binding MarR family transcriptional regulator